MHVENVKSHRSCIRGAAFQFALDSSAGWSELSSYVLDWLLGCSAIQRQGSLNVARSQPLWATRSRFIDSIIFLFLPQFRSPYSGKVPRNTLFLEEFFSCMSCHTVVLGSFVTMCPFSPPHPPPYLSQPFLALFVDWFVWVHGFPSLGVRLVKQTWCIHVGSQANSEFSSSYCISVYTHFCKGPNRNRII